MSFSEIIIMYLTFGAPFGVYHYLQNRSSHFRVSNAFFSIAVATIWIGYAVKMARDTIFIPNDEFDTVLFSDSQISDNLERSQKDLFRALGEVKIQNPATTNFSVFELRETLERFVGLTLELKNVALNSKPTAPELEVFKIVGRTTDSEIGGICIHRRNVIRLRAHREKAREDFLATTVSLYVDILTKNPKNETLERFRDSSIQIADELDDHQTARQLEQKFNAAKERNGNDVRFDDDFPEKFSVSNQSELAKAAFSVHFGIIPKVRQ